MSWRLAKLQGFVEGCHDKLQAHRLFQKSDHRGKAETTRQNLMRTFGWTPENSRPRFSARFWIFPRGRQAHCSGRLHFAGCIRHVHGDFQAPRRGNVEIWTGSWRRVRETDAETRGALGAGARTGRPASDASNKLFPTEAIDLGGQASGDQPPAVANAAAGNEGDQLNIALTRLRQRLEKMKKC